MAQVIGQIDSLTSLLNSLEQNGISEFQSLQDIIDFKASYPSKIKTLELSIKEKVADEITHLEEELKVQTNELQELLEQRDILLIKEKEELPVRIDFYSTRDVSFLKHLYFSLLRFKLNRRLKRLTNHYDKEKRKPFRSREKSLQQVRSKLVYYENHFEEEIQKRLVDQSKSLNNIKHTLDKLNDSFYGAIGENKAVEVLKNLPDSYTVINGFKLYLKKPYYNKTTKDTILSIQADHIVVGPTGIFLIETKNWNQSTMERNDIYSPIDQVKRSGYALYRYLNDEINGGFFTFLTGIWTKKVSIRNIVLMINYKPTEKYDFVKIASLYQVNGYITYFKEVYNEQIVQQLVKHLTKN